MEDKGCVYFFRHIGLTPIKIGYSTNISPIDRFNQFKTYAPYGSEIIGFIITNEAKSIETFLHKKYTSKRLIGEWFEITEEEALHEIDLYSSKEDVKDRNEFQIAWAKKLADEKAEIKIKELDVYNFKRANIVRSKSLKDVILKEYTFDPEFNRTALSNKLKVSRVTIQRYINELKNEN